MRKYFAFEIEANEKPMLSYGEWENLQNYTSDIATAKDSAVAAYGEIKDGRYIALYEI